MIARRVSPVLFLILLVVTPLAAEAQQPAGKVYRIGGLSPGSPAAAPVFREALTLALRERGWIEGQNLTFERRYAEGKFERLPELAAELVRLKAELIVAVGTRAALAAKQATTTIPIVMFYATDPVRAGLVASLARPDGNITGLSDDVTPDVRGKEMQFLKEAVPMASRVVVLTRHLQPVDESSVKPAEEAVRTSARSLGMHFQIVRVNGPEDFKGTFAAMVKDRADALLVADWALFRVHLRQIIDLAARYRLPAIYEHRAYVTAGGLMAYGPDDRETPRRVTAYIDKILKGAKPADLPVEQPTKFELVINMRTAKALGLTIPPSVLVRADELIQ